MKTQTKLKCSILLAFIITVIFCIFPLGAYSAVQPGDIQGHWAQQAIQEMIDQGAVTGMPDGNFKPDSSITRAEFAVMLVKTFHLESHNGKAFNDIEEHWAKNYIMTANARGIVTGYSDIEFGPDDPVTREQMAVMVVKTANLHSSGIGLNFKDNTQVSSWAINAVEIACENKVITGFPDRSFRPQESATRAEAVVIIMNAQKIMDDNTPPIKPENYERAGIYGPDSGSATISNDVIISASGITLQNIIIEGKLTVAKSVGEGTVTLKNIVVNGSTYIYGGGTNSIYLIDSQTGKTYISKDEGPVRVVISGTTEINELIAQSSTNIQEIGLTGRGLDDIIVSNKTNGGIVVDLTGLGISSLIVETDNVQIITDINTTINDFTANAQVEVTGDGTIENADVNASGVTFDTQPTSLTVAEGVDAPTITDTSYNDDSTILLLAISDITGITETGSVLTAGIVTPEGATVSYKWQICDSADGLYTDIAGATASTYTAVVSDADKYIRVVANGINSYSGTVTSLAVLIQRPVQATPTFNPAAEAVPFGTTVTITSDGADAIYYTTDGSDPTTASYNQATTPLLINAEITVKALAVKADYTNSAIASATYTQAKATAPSSITLAAGSTRPVGGVTNVAIPVAGATDTTGAVTDWVTATNDRIKFTVSDDGAAASTITINGAGYTTGTDYTIAAASTLTIVVITTEANYADCVRTFTVSVTPAPAQTTPTFSPAAGAVPFGTAVMIASDGADAIYYTTNDSDPTTMSNNQATTPLVINAEITVKAMAIKAGLTNSAIASATYTQAQATAPSTITLAAGSTNPVGGVTNVAIPAAGATDTTGAVTDWVTATNDRIKFTVSDAGAASSTIKINGSNYTSGTDYTIAAALPLTIVITTTETNRADCVRTFTVSVTPAPAQATPTFSPAAGAVPFGTAVMIASDGADAIYYTTNDSDPTTLSNNQAITPLVINAEITVKAMAIKAGLTNSAIASAAYTQAQATVPSSITLATGSTNPVGGVTNVAIPAAGATDTTGAITGWITGTQDRITFTVSDDGKAASTITINGADYTSGTDYTIPAASTLTIVVTTTEANYADCVRTFTVSVTAAPAQATPTFSPAAGAVPFGTPVMIASDGADAIYYTTNDSDPTTMSNNQATTPLVINAEITVKAMAIKAGLTNSTIASAAYTQAQATVPSSITLAAGSTNPVGGVTNVAIPAAGATDTTGAVTDWVTATNDRINFTVSDDGKAASTITINGADYTSGNEYTIPAASTLTIVVTTTEANYADCVRTFTVSVTAAPAQATPTFSPAAGAVPFETPVMIASDGADAIYYTTDDSDPTTMSNNQAITPLVINAEIIVKAMAIKAGFTNSNIASAAYTQAQATAPSSITLAAGSTNPVGGVTNVAIPAAGATDTTGAVTDWITGTNDRITFTVSDAGKASSTIKINGSNYTSGTDYTIATASTLNIVVTTTETNRADCVRTFTVSVTQAPATAPSSVVLAQGSTTPVGGVTNVSIPAAGETDTTGAVIDWIGGIQDQITFTVSDGGGASSTIKINGSNYTSGTDYTIASATTLTIVVTTTETNRADCVRTFSVSVSKSSNTNLAIKDGSIISSLNNTSKEIVLPSFMSEGLKTAGQVKSAVESLDGSIQSYQMLGGDRSIMADDTYIGGTCYLIVTAADEVTTTEYEVYYNS